MCSLAFSGQSHALKTILFQIFVSAEDEDSNLYEVMDSDPMDKTFLGAIDTAQLKDVFTQSQSPPYPKNLLPNFQRNCVLQFLTNHIALILYQTIKYFWIKFS